jgi:site-specific DNA-methyltransferase (adenine-specific)
MNRKLKRTRARPVVPGRQHLTSDRDDWNTPLEVLHPVRVFAGAEGIGLDPCSNEHSIVGAAEAWETEGLDRDWSGHGLVFCNPPYGRKLLAWAKKVATEAQRGVEIIVLVPARPETKWTKLFWLWADRVCFWKKRIAFIGAITGATFPSALIYFGPRGERFRQVFARHGVILTRWYVLVRKVKKVAR